MEKTKYPEFAVSEKYFFGAGLAITAVTLLASLPIFSDNRVVLAFSIAGFGILAAAAGLWFQYLNVKKKQQARIRELLCSAKEFLVGTPFSLQIPKVIKAPKELPRNLLNQQMKVNDLVLMHSGAGFSLAVLEENLDGEETGSIPKVHKNPLPAYDFLFWSDEFWFVKITSKELSGLPMAWLVETIETYNGKPAMASAGQRVL